METKSQITDNVSESLLLSLCLEPQLSPEETERLARLEETPEGMQEAAQLRAMAEFLKQLPKGTPLPHSVIEPEPMDVPEGEMPDGLMARLLAIPDQEVALSEELEQGVAPLFQKTPMPEVAIRPALVETHAHWAERPRQAPVAPSWMERLRGVWQRWQWAVTAGLATALVLMMARPFLMPERSGIATDPLGPEGMGSVVKGHGDASPSSSTAASLSLVAQAGADAVAVRVSLEPLREGAQGAVAYGARLEAGQAVLPVLQVQEVDLAARPRHVVVIAVESGGNFTELYRSPGAISLTLLPDTEHLYALPEPIQLPAAGTAAARISRLYVLMTPAMLEDGTLQVLARQAAGALLEPSLLLTGVQGEGAVEATLLVEVR